MRSLLAAARRSQRLLASGWRAESTSAVPAPLADGTETSNVYLAYSRPQPEPFNDNVVFESHPETKVRRPLLALGYARETAGPKLFKPLTAGLTHAALSLGACRTSNVCL